MKVQFLGDSFGLPRFYEHDGFDYENYGKTESGKVIQLHYEDTYPEKVRRGLQNRFPDEDVILINNCAQVYNSYNLMGDFKTAYLHQPNYLVVQVGIVDSSPRLPDAIAPYPFMNGKSPWISINEFQNNLLAFIQLCLTRIDKLDAMILVNIVKASDDHYQRHPGALKNTIAYNQAISKLSRLRTEKGNDRDRNGVNVYLADMFSIVGQCGWQALCTDGVHINATGSQCLANEIVEKIAVDYTKNRRSEIGNSLKKYSEFRTESMNTEVIDRIAQIREGIAICNTNSIPMQVTELLTLVVDNIMFDTNNADETKVFNQILEACFQVIESQKYFDLANILECRLKSFLNI